ncbi:MAG: galactokinase [Gammaproteobacteria bacterium]|nr:galactokinase [Gammaproteobacteria bacterium]
MSGDASITVAFERRFGGKPLICRAPGRINIIGAHADYNEGLVLPTTTALYTRVAIASRHDQRIRAWSENFGDGAEFDLPTLQRSDNRHWSDYVKAVVSVLQDTACIKSGFDILINGDLPLGGGLSSSASLETALGYALISIGGNEVDRRQLALLCQRAEAEFVGARCGIMDQYAISCGASGHATLLDCREIRHQDIPLPQGMDILVVDTGVKHELAAGGLNERREECEAAVAALQTVLPGIHALRDVTPGQLENNRELLGELLFTRSRHIVTELQRVREAATALAAGDVARVGALVSESHASSRDDYDVSCDELEALVEILSGCRGCHGARLVGAGFGGCAIGIFSPPYLEEAMNTVSAKYGRMLGRAPWMHAVRPSGPVDISLPA